MNQIWLNAVRASARAAVAPWWRAGGAPEPVAAYQPIGAASLADSYLRVAGTGGNANLDPAVVGSGVAPTWASGTGWQGSATAWLNTGIVPDNDQTWSVLVRFGNTPAGFTGQRLFGIGITAGRRFTIEPTAANYQNGGSLSATAVTIGGGGVWGFAGNVAYRDGMAESGTISAPILGTLNVCLLLASNPQGLIGNVSGGSIWGGTMQAVAIYDTTLTASQVAAVSAAMAAL